MADTPISSRRPARASTGCLVIFFSIFALVGGAGFWFTTVRPGLALLASRSWQETSCVILSSKVAESSSSDGSTYKVDVLYSYSVDGRSYQSTRYRFDDWSSSGRQAKADVVERLPPGTRTTCWVDPADPGRAVLSRDVSPVYLIGLFPLVFLLIGGGGIVWALRAGRIASAAPLADPSTPFGIAAPAGGDAAPVELRPTATPLGKFVGMTFFTLFWNGIVSVFVVFDLQGWRDKTPNGCLTAFLVPFVLIGLGAIVATIRQFLILFNPRVHLTLTPGTLTPGGMAYLQWRLTGRGAGVRRLRIVLEGKEEARYRRGTSTYTDHNTFATVAVADTTQAFEIPAGNARVDVPAEAVPSFTATHNKIIWSIKVACEIAGWPDSDDEYQVIVRPGAGFGEVA